MTEELALHTAARRYCEERAVRWRVHYASMGSHIDHAGYTKDERNIFPRYNVLEAILVEVERLRPVSLASGQQARDLLSLAGQVAESSYTKSSNGSIQTRAMQQERDLFCAHMNNLDAQALADVSPMPSRRVLTEEESKAAWERVRQRWGIAGGYWFPLQGDVPPDAVAFDADAFEQHVPTHIFQGILGGHGLQHVFEMREYGPEYELELGLVVPSYNGVEAYWTAGEFDWLVYASHESTVTVAGDWLVHSVQQQWPTWPEHLVQW